MPSEATVSLIDCMNKTFFQVSICLWLCLRRRWLLSQLKTSLEMDLCKDFYQSCWRKAWDDVPTLKTINELNMTKRQKVLFILFGKPVFNKWATLVFTCMIMHWCNMRISLSSLGKSLPELLKPSKVDITLKYGMKRGPVLQTDLQLVGEILCPKPVISKWAEELSRGMRVFTRRIFLFTTRKQSMTRYLGRTNTAYDVSLGTINGLLQN